ncbi:ATP-binding protein [Streptomyces fungicidicus]|uniref:ATP-binding protein n=1 Tax=Streptomyces fungicidicus TaxID=68203 RepID=UPI0037B3FBA9
MIPSAPLGTDAAAGSVSLGAASASDLSGSVAERRFRFELAAHPGSPAQARRLTRARLNGWSVCEDTCDTAALVVSELVTNAIVHTASSRIVCELHDGGELVRIAVGDEGCAPDQPRANTRQQPEDEHGRGLLLVDALCHSWGAHENGTGLLVWADLPRTADAPAEPAKPAEPAEPANPAEPTGDLGWGARPKPGPPGTPDDSDPDEPEQSHRTRAAAPGHRHLPAPAGRRAPRTWGRA